MAERDDLERTEAPTPKRIRDAREDGQVPRSRELATLALLGGTGLALIAGGRFWGDGIAALMRDGLAFERRVATEPSALVDHTLSLFANAVLVLLPILAVAFAAGAAGYIAVGGWNFTAKGYGFRMQRLDPRKGLANLVSGHAATELAKAVMKAAGIGALAVVVLYLRHDDVVLLATQPLADALAHGLALVRDAFLWLLGALAVIATVDVPLQLRSHFKRLRMSREEIRREQKELEGDPHIKARIRGIQRERARRRMMAAIPTADVVVTNPTHYAVALKYDPTTAAPRVVAKGVEELARRIREAALAHSIPVVEAPALARALYRHVELEAQIPRALFEAVAILLAYVFQLRESMTRGGEAPSPPAELPVPASLDPAASAGAGEGAERPSGDASAPESPLAAPSPPTARGRA